MVHYICTFILCYSFFFSYISYISRVPGNSREIGVPGPGFPGKTSAGHIPSLVLPLIEVRFDKFVSMGRVLDWDMIL